MMDWRDTTLAPDRTHHLWHGRPFYPQRFQAVGKFHAPGLAPALGEDGALHVRPDGEPAYAQRFLRTFGFYEGLAAVVTAQGWTHIHPDGSPAHPERHAWCGNFQDGRCPVRGDDGLYHHILADGRPLSTERWRYVGDYRDGVAVVQRADGLHSHVDHQGCLLHHRWFLDLDVFHKSFARARDTRGWTHVNIAGLPIYTRRFVAVEPFYNGQARVECFDGSLEVVDEEGRTLVVLRPGKRVPSDLDRVSADLVAWWRSEALTTAVASGLLDRLPLPVEPMAEPVRRLLGALAELGFVMRAGSRWETTERGRLLRQDHPLSLAAAARYWATEGRLAWSMLGRALHDPAWKPADPFAGQAPDAVRVAAFHAAMRPYALHDYQALPDAIHPDHRHLVDAGGGTGTLAGLLLEARPQLRVTLLDRPEVVALAEPHGPRFTAHSADLFGPWGLDADAVVLARVLHDWDDTHALALLERARQVLPSGGRIYVIEMMKDPQGFSGALLDLHMLLATGGQERSEAEYRALLAVAGFLPLHLHPLPSVSDVLVAEVP